MAKLIIHQVPMQILAEESDRKTEGQTNRQTDRHMKKGNI